MKKRKQKHNIIIDGVVCLPTPSEEIMKKKSDLAEMKFQHTEKVFAVLIRRKNGTEFLAYGPPGGPAFYYDKKPAEAFQSELAARDLPGRVISAHATIKESK